MACNPLMFILWLIILIFVGFWIAGIAAGVYIILIPFTVCIPPLTELTDLLLKGVQLPLYCAQQMMGTIGPPQVYYAPGTLPRWALHSAQNFNPESAKRPSEAGVPLSATWASNFETIPSPRLYQRDAWKLAFSILTLRAYQPQYTSLVSKVVDHTVHRGSSLNLPSCPVHRGNSPNHPSCPVHRGNSPNLSSCPVHRGNSPNLPSCPVHRGNSLNLPSYPVQHGNSLNFPSCPVHRAVRERRNKRAARRQPKPTSFPKNKSLGSSGNYRSSFIPGTQLQRVREYY
uniref:Uncharacterized protein n=1 Tax=Timema bartmani TaxID=61472 RepID=A0A7R9I1X6_9NEOP|nr:unnamed protein product [Timema bartmani]